MRDGAYGAVRGQILAIDMVDRTDVLVRIDEALSEFRNRLLHKSLSDNQGLSASKAHRLRLALQIYSRPALAPC